MLILLLAAFLRLYRLPDMAGFNFDQEYAANFAYNVLRVYPVQLIGQPLSVEGLFMGPWYFYYLVPFFAFTNLEPSGGFIGSVIFSLLIISTYFWVGKKIFGTEAGLIAAFIRSILPIELGNDLAMAPSYASELLILITWLLFYKYWYGQTKYLPILGFVFGMYTSIHPILFPFYIVFLILLLIVRKLPDIRTLLFSIFAFLIPVSPLLLFEYFHKFLEVKRLFQVFAHPSSGVNRSSDFLKYLSFNAEEPRRVLTFFFLQKEVFLVLFFLCLFFVIYKQVGFWKDNFHKAALFITYAVFIIYYTFFPTHVPEYYFQALSTLALVYLSATLAFLTKKPFLKVILALLLLNIAYTSTGDLVNKWNNPSKGSLAQKEFIVKEIVSRVSPNQEFYVSYITPLGANFGFDYLFKYYGKIPQTKEAKPPVFTIVLPKSLSIDSINISAGNIGLILPRQ